MTVRTPRVLHVSCAGGGGTDAILQEYPTAVPEVEHLFLLRPGVPVPHRLDGEPCWAAEVPPTPRAAASALRIALRTQRPDVVHAHSSWAGALARAFAGRTPVVYTPHCYAMERTGQGAFARLAVTAVERILARRTAAVLAVGPREAAIARGLQAGAVVDVVYQCFHDRPADRSVQPSSATPSEVLAVVACGRLAPQKDPAAVAALQRDLGDRIQITWIGGGAGADAADLAAAGTEVTGWLDAEGARARLAAADVLVHAARWEGFPLVVFEAIAAGVPVVILDAPYLLGTGLPGVHPDLAAVEQTLGSLAAPEARTALWMRQRDWYDAIRATRPEATLASRYRVVARVDGRVDQGSMARW